MNTCIDSLPLKYTAHYHTHECNISMDSTIVGSLHSHIQIITSQVWTHHMLTLIDTYHIRGVYGNEILVVIKCTVKQNHNTTNECPYGM